MGMETRIGIATGLLIVVVAGVYFFYGSHRAGEDLLITLDSAGPPPKIPISNQQQRAKPRHQTNSTKARANRPPSNSGKRSTDVRPVRSRTPTKTVTRKAHGRSAKLPRRNPAFRPPTAKRTGTNRLAHQQSPAAVSRADRPNAIPHRRPVTALKTGPSQKLVSATRKNLQSTRSQVPPNTASRVDQTHSDRGNRAKLPISQSTAGKVAMMSVPTAEPQEKTRRSGNRWPKQHTISSGDTLTSISYRYYSTRRNIRLILKANPQIKKPKALKIGDTLFIPAPPPEVSTAQLAAGDTSHSRKNARQTKIKSRSGTSRAHVSSSKTYRVRRGDTFYSIAERILGSGARWKELYDNNRALVKNDPKRLSPGMTVILPK